MELGGIGLEVALTKVTANSHATGGFAQRVAQSGGEDSNGIKIGLQGIERMPL